MELNVSDIILGGTSGMELLRQMKKMGLKCPVVMITGYPCDKTISESEQLGAFRYMHKPVKKNDILHVTHMALVTDRPNKATHDRPNND